MPCQREQYVDEVDETHETNDDLDYLVEGHRNAGPVNKPDDEPEDEAHHDERNDQGEEAGGGDHGDHGVANCASMVMASALSFGAMAIRTSKSRAVEVSPLVAARAASKEA